jgi:hypothetical protein
MTDLLDSDFAVYAGTSVVTTLALIVVLGLLVTVVGIDIAERTLAGFVGGYVIATIVYYAAYELYDYVDLHEHPLRSQDR